MTAGSAALAAVEICCELVSKHFGSMYGS